MEAVERKSSRLEVNDIKTKVRRTEPLPAYDETAPSRFRINNFVLIIINLTITITAWYQSQFLL